MSRFAVVPAAYVLFRRDDEVLLQLRQNTGFLDGHWAVAAAGHVEAGESAVDCAVREASEELGVVIRPEELVPLCAMHRTNGPGPVEQRVDWFFECPRWDGTPVRREPHKNAALQWFPLTAPPEPTVPHERYVLGLLAQGAVPPIITYGFPRR